MTSPDWKWTHATSTAPTCGAAGLQGLKTPLDNLRGVTLGEDQLPDLTQLAVAALRLTVRND